MKLLLCAAFLTLNGTRFFRILKQKMVTNFSKTSDPEKAVFINEDKNQILTWSLLTNKYQTFQDACRNNIYLLRKFRDAISLRTLESKESVLQDVYSSDPKFFSKTDSLQNLFVINFLENGDARNLEGFVEITKVGDVDYKIITINRATNSATEAQPLDYKIENEWIPPPNRYEMSRSRRVSIKQQRLKVDKCLIIIGGSQEFIKLLEHENISSYFNQKDKKKGFKDLREKAKQLKLASLPSQNNKNAPETEFVFSSFMVFTGYTEDLESDDAILTGKDKNLRTNSPRRKFSEEEYLSDESTKSSSSNQIDTLAENYAPQDPTWDRKNKPRRNQSIKPNQKSNSSSYRESLANNGITTTQRKSSLSSSKKKQN